MNKQIEWINFIEKTHDEELKIRFSENQSDEDSIDMGESIRNDCCDLFKLKEKKSKVHLMQLSMIYYQAIRKRKIKYLIVFVTNGNNLVLLILP